MKNIYCEMISGLHKIWKSKLLRIMRIVLFLLVVFITHSFATVSYAQSTRLSLNFEDETIVNILDKIENESEFYFMFDATTVDVFQRRTIDCENQPVKKILDKILEGTGIIYKVEDRQIVLSSIKNANSLQQKVVNGKVSDQDKTPLPGVSVVIKGTPQGTVTNSDGEYSLTNISDNTTLVFSFVGMRTQEVVVGNQTVIDIVMEEEAVGIEEVVAIGYGVQKRTEVTGSVAAINLEDMEDQPVGQLMQKVQGRLAGVQIGQSSGALGSGMSIRVRGAASINAGNTPLYVVDGFPVVNGIASINPNEVEDISVLKGASAAALYGSRAANGVVLITTKSAKKDGVAVVRLDVTSGVGNVPQQGREEMMNAQEFLEDRKAVWEDRIKYEGGAEVPELYRNPDAWTGPDTDWYDVILQTSVYQDYNLSLFYKNDKIQTATNLGYHDEKGSVISTDFKRYSLRSNNIYNVSDFMRIGVNVAPTFQTTNNAQTEGFYGIMYTAIITPPIFSPDETNPDGTIKSTFSGPGLFTFPNWKRTLLETTDRSEGIRLLSNAYAEIDFLKDFRFKTSVSADWRGSRRRYYNPSNVGTIFSPPPRIASAGYETTFVKSWATENTLKYIKTFAENHNVEALVGYSAQKYTQEYSEATGNTFPDNEVTWVNAASEKSSTSWATEWSLVSAFSRLNYNYKGKYLFSASIRRDGSSRFGYQNQWGTFPSISAGWTISEEDFLKELSFLSFLKLRGEYGETGNFNIGNYTQFGNISPTNYVLGNSIVLGRSQTSLANSTLTWETTAGIGVGLDVGLFKDRVSLTFDYYDKTTDGMLYQIDIPLGTGFSNIQSNIGEFHFWGYEFSASTKNMVGDFKWNTDLNISFNRNKVMKLGTNDFPIGGLGLYMDDPWKTEVGQPMGQFWGFVFDGIYMTQEEFDSQPKASSSAVGTVRYKDISDDGEITDEDQTYIGNPNPDFVFGMNNSFSYKNFDMNIVFTGSYGGEVMKAILQWSETLEGIFNIEKYMANRWRSPENTGDGIIGRSLSGTTAFPRRNNSRYVFDSSHLAVKNITLGYTLPKVTEYVNNIRLYMSIQNALLITNYTGPNPEASLHGLNGLNQGVDWSPYPLTRIYTLGLNVTF